MKNWDKIFREGKNLPNWVQEEGGKTYVSLLKKLFKKEFRLSIGPKALDIGCALGYMTECLHKEGFEATGIDGSIVSINKAQKLYPHLVFLHGELEEFEEKLNPRIFDLILCRAFSPLYNADSIETAVEIIKRFVKFLSLNGVLILHDSLNNGNNIKTLQDIARFKEILPYKCIGPYYPKPFLTFLPIVKFKPLIFIVNKLFEYILLRLLNKKAQYIILIKQ